LVYISNDDGAVTLEGLGHTRKYVDIGAGPEWSM